MDLLAGLVIHQHFAVLDVADIARADDVERAGLRRDDRAAVEFAEHEGADAERVARGDQLLVGQRDQRIGAFERAQRLDELVDEQAAPRTGDEMQDRLGVGGRLHDRALAHELVAQGDAVGEIAVMGDRKAARIEFGEQRLNVAQEGRAGRRVAHMADGELAGQLLDHVALGEGLLDEAEPALGMVEFPVESDDAGRLFPAVLQGVQAERGDRGGVAVAIDPEQAAFLAQAVAVEIVAAIEGPWFVLRAHRVPRL